MMIFFHRGLHLFFPLLIKRLSVFMSPNSSIISFAAVSFSSAVLHSLKAIAK